KRQTAMGKGLGDAEPYKNRAVRLWAWRCRASVGPRVGQVAAQVADPDPAGHTTRVVEEVHAGRGIAALPELDVRRHVEPPRRVDLLRDAEGPGLTELGAPVHAVRFLHG